MNETLPLRRDGDATSAARAASSRQLWLVAVVFGVLFVALQIQSSLHSGVLSLPVTYDDVMYLNEGLARVEVLYRSGARAFLAGFWTNPPHAPLSTLQAVLAFTLAGPHRWAADAASVIPLVLLLRLFLGYATRWLPLATSAAIAAALLTFPIFGLLVLEFRPDPLCALLTACGALIVATDVSWMHGRRRTQATIGALLVGALLSKPTLAPVTLVVFGVAVAASIFMHTRTKAEAWRAGRLALVVGGICFLVVLPYYAAVFRTLYSYIMVNAFGKNASIWAPKLENPLAYYLTGMGGQASIGRTWLILSCLLVLVTAPMWLKQWRAAVAVVVVCLTGYVSVTLPDMKSAFVGMVVPALIVCVVALVTMTALARVRMRWSGAAAALLLVLGWGSWHPVIHALAGGAIAVSRSQNTQRIYEQTVATLATVPDLGQKRLYMPVIAQYLNADNLEFGLRARGLGALGALVAPTFEPSLDVHRAELAKADVVLVFSDDSTLPLEWPASYGIRKEINQMVEQAGLVTVGAVDGGPYLGSVRVLARKPPGPVPAKPSP